MWPFSRGKTDAVEPDWLERQLAAERRIESLELRLGDIVERFTRFQNRENMRRGREKEQTPPELLDEAKELLDQSTGGNGSPPEKLRGGQSWAAWSADMNRRKRGLPSS